ncbi:MAG: FkbM family methyltransferase [Alphaproteobacteria bacterium]|nr:FkbM family methyltransferase [Alphaproteobacteria bacterium]
MSGQLSLDQALARAKREAERGHFDEATKTLKAILKAAPGQPQALQMLGMIALEEGRNSMEEALLRLSRLGLSPHRILDIGAYEGWWARLARNIFPNAHIQLFEAQYEKEAALQTVVREIGNADLHMAVLGSDSGREVDFLIPETPYGTTGSSLYAERTDFKHKVRKVTIECLDDLILEPEFFDLIKLDVQGAEIDILKGAPRLLGKAQAVIAELSFLAYNQGAPLFAEVVRYLDEQGFQLLDFADLQRGKMGVLYQADAVFLRKGSALVPDKVW